MLECMEEWGKREGKAIRGREGTEGGGKIEHAQMVSSSGDARYTTDCRPGTHMVPVGAQYVTT